MTTPIFVIGCPRTGTTWLSNILCRHKDISCIQAKRHYGIHESAFFWKLYGRFGSLDNRENYIELVKNFIRTDYFYISSMDKKIFLKKERPTKYEDFFRFFMDEYSKKHNNDFWLEKTPAHTFYLSDLLDYYPDALFISIQRDIIDKIKSRMKLEKDTRSISKMKRILSEIIANRTCNMYINNLSEKSDRILTIQYKDLRENKTITIKKICDFIGISFEDKMLVQIYPRNTSYISKNERREILSKNEEELCYLIYKLIEKAPDFIFKSFSNFYKKRSLNDDFPVWFWYDDNKYMDLK